MANIRKEKTKKLRAKTPVRTKGHYGIGGGPKCNVGPHQYQQYVNALSRLNQKDISYLINNLREPLEYFTETYQADEGPYMGNWDNVKSNEIFDKRCDPTE